MTLITKITNYIEFLVSKNIEYLKSEPEQCSKNKNILLYTKVEFKNCIFAFFKKRKFITKKFYLFSTTCFNHPLSGHTIADTSEYFVRLRILRYIIPNTVSKEKSQLQKIDGYFYRTNNHIRTARIPTDSHKQGPIVRFHPTHETYVIPQSKSFPSHFSSIFISPRLLITTTMLFSFRSYKRQR